METNKTIIDAAKKVVRSIKLDSRRRDIDATELSAASIAADVYRKSKNADLSLIRRFFSFIAAIFRWNKGVRPRKMDSTEWVAQGYLVTESGDKLITDKQEKIRYE
jgi:hypothetical protein